SSGPPGVAVRCKIALRMPAAPGLKVSLRLQGAAAGKSDRPVQPSMVTAKSAALAPVMPAPTMPVEVPPLLDTATLLSALVLPTTTDEKSTIAGPLSVAPARPLQL